MYIISCNLNIQILLFDLHIFGNGVIEIRGQSFNRIGVHCILSETRRFRSLSLAIETEETLIFIPPDFCERGWISFQEFHQAS